MRKTGIYRVISLLLTVLLMADIVILFSIFQNKILSPNQTTVPAGMTYFLFIVLVSLGLLLFISNLLSLKKVSSDTKPANIPVHNQIMKKEIEKSDTRETKNAEETMDESSQEMDADVSPYVKKIVPRYANTKDPDKFTERLLINLAGEFEIVEGLFYIKTKGNTFTISGLYAYFADEKPQDFKEGEGINGQVVKNKTTLNVNNVPEGYIRVLSGLGESSPRHMLFVPIIFEDEVVGLLELASFKEFDMKTEHIISKLSGFIGEGLTSILKGEKKTNG